MNNVSLAATYFVDNHSAAYFPSINESLVSPSSIGMLFEVKGLTPGPHRLNVLYVGNSPNSKPLNITYLLTQNGTVTVPNSSTTIHRKPVIGGVIGLVLISLLLNILQSQVLWLVVALIDQNYQEVFIIRYTCVITGWARKGTRSINSTVAPSRSIMASDQFPDKNYDRQ